MFSLVFSLETVGKLIEIDARDGKLRVVYGDRLTVLIDEVRQLSNLGYDIPSKIRKCVDTGKQFFQYGVELQAVRFRSFFCLSNLFRFSLQLAHFYNTIDSEMVPSQQPMMIDLAKNFERLIREHKGSRKKESSIH